MQEVQRATAIPRADEERRSGNNGTHTIETRQQSGDAAEAHRTSLPPSIPCLSALPAEIFRAGLELPRGRQAVMNRTGPAFSRRANSWMERENGVSGWLRIGNGSNSPATHISAAGGTTPSTPQPSRLPNSDGERNSMKGVLLTTTAPTASGRDVMDRRSVIFASAA